MNFIRDIYSWFKSLYGNELYNYLKGMDCNYDVTNPNQFVLIFLVTIVIVALITCCYYFIRHSSFNKIGSWFVVMAVVFLISLGIGFGMTYSKQVVMPDYVLYGVENVEPDYDDDGNPICEECNCLHAKEDATEIITTYNFVGFGVANAVIAVIFYILLSFVVKRFSKDCTHTPWKSKFLTRNN